MTMMRIRSIIKEYFSDDLIHDLERVYRAKTKMKVHKKIMDNTQGKTRKRLKVIPGYEDEEFYTVEIRSNNDKINISKAYLEYTFGENCGFATGTNRFAFLIDGYAIKIAQDPEGVQDNFHEFYMSKIAYPWVTKVYETNGLISVHEYIRVLSTDVDFQNAVPKILSTLKQLEDISSVMLDMGCIQKNRSNWGIRPSTGEAVPLDFAYMYTELESIDLTCDSKECTTKNGIVPLVYTEDYSTLMCPKCKKRYSDQELHSLIDEDSRRKMYITMKDNRRYPIFKVTKPVSYFEVDAFGDVEEKETFVGDTRNNKKEIVRVKKEDAQRLLNRYMELNTDFENRKITDTPIEEYEMCEFEEIRKTLCEYRFNKKYKDMNETEKNFDPLHNYKVDEKPNSYKEREEVKFVDDVVIAVNNRFSETNNSNRNKIIQGILNDVYDTDSIFTPNKTIKEILHRKYCKEDKPFVNEYTDSILDDLEENILEYKETSPEDRVIDHTHEDIMQEFFENDKEAHFMDYEDYLASSEDSEILLDPDLKKFDVYQSNAQMTEDGSVLVSYSFSEVMTEYNLDELNRMNLPIWDDYVGMNVLEIRVLGDNVYIQYDHPGFKYIGDGEYEVDEDQVQEDLDFIDNGKINQEVYDDNMSEEDFKALNNQLNERMMRR